MSALEESLVFVDLETTGMSYTRGRVIEVAAIRVENKQVTETFTSLVDPQTELPQFISSLTGITQNDLADAPTFYDIADELYRLLDGAIFVAHNVRFDFGFLKQEFKRLNKPFRPRMLCTVKLSRALYPDVQGHRLQNLIERCGIEVESRHRAKDDASAMWQFIQHIQQNFPAPLVDKAIRLQLKSPSLPKNLDKEFIQKLPEESGVYIFQDDAGKPLYIGKSINIKKRVLSHFSADHKSDGEFKISQQVGHIETIVTAGELEALLLESKLIKDMQPLYNRKLRRHQKLCLVRKAVNHAGYITLSYQECEQINPESVGEIMGVYSTKGKAHQFTSQISKDFGLCPKLMDLEKSNGRCFASQLKKCFGACIGKEPASQYNKRLLAAFEGRALEKWPYRTPIIIEEKNDSDELRSIIVDNWCVIANISQQPECEPQISIQDKMFDLDTYKILRSFLYVKAHKLKIKPVPVEWVKQASLNGVV